MPSGTEDRFAHRNVGSESLRWLLSPLAGLPVQLASGQCRGHNVLATSGGATPLPSNSGKVSWPSFPAGERGLPAGNSACSRAERDSRDVEWTSQA